MSDQARAAGKGQKPGAARPPARTRKPAPRKRSRAPLGGTAGALKRYRLMAFVVGTGLAIVCFIGIPLQVAGGNKWPWTSVVVIVGTAHGIFYIVYLLACLDLASRARLRLAQLLGMVCSGFLPLLAFYMERKVYRRVSDLLALGPDAPPAPAVVLVSTLRGRRSTPAPDRTSTPVQATDVATDEARSTGPLP